MAEIADAGLRKRPVALLALALASALLFTTAVLLLAGAPPLEAYQLVLGGWLSSPATRADMIMVSSSLLLCAVGLTITFAAGLYNLGVEGQVGLGAICCMWVMRAWPELPPPLLWSLAIGAGALGGAAWALVAALLKRYGRVSEIFAGLGLNFLATGLALYLIAGPWKKPGTASVTGTEQLSRDLWLPTLEGLRLAPALPALALVALALVWFVLARSRWGLDVRATGMNALAAERLGVPATRRMFEALAACGALAGIAGALQVLAVFHALISNVSSGIGLLALLVVLLVNARPAFVLPVTLLFAAFAVGALKLPLTLGVDSSLAGVMQGALVLFALIARGLRTT
jgi:simple sugar transport system permease protein